MLRLNETFYNPAKHLLKDGKKVLGAWLQMSSPYAAEIFAKAEIDVLMVDMEHGPNDILSLIEQFRAMGRFNAVMEFFLCILSVAVISVGGYLIMQGRMDTVDLITFSLYISTFITPVRKLSNFAEIFTNGALLDGHVAGRSRDQWKDSFQCDQGAKL